MEEQQKTVKAHKLVVNNRKTSMVTGVLDVLSFDLNEILLETEQGMLLVKGTDLHVNRLSVEKGEVDLSGTIDSVSYSNISQAKKQEESFWTKMIQVRKKEDAKYQKKELLVFFCACLTGVNVRAGYEILIFLRKMIIHNNLVKGIEDLFYWIFMSAYIFSQIYATMYGSIRWYFLLGLVFGVAVIQKLISSGAKKYTKKNKEKNLEIIRKNR